MSSNSSLALRPVPGAPAPARPHPGGLLVAATVYALAVALTCAVFVWTHGGQTLDGRLLPRAERGGTYQQDTDLVGPAKEVLAFFGDTGVLAVMLAVVVLVGTLTRRFWAGVAGVAVFGGSIATTTVLKLAIPRPELDVDGSTTHNSFASGHAAAAMGLLCALVLVVPARARWWVAVPAAAGVSVVASATMVLGWHRLSDVVGGTLVASALCCLAAAGLLAWRGVRVERGRHGWLKGAFLLVVTPLPAIAAALTLPTGSGLFTAIVIASAVTALAVAPVVFLLGAVDFARHGRHR